MSSFLILTVGTSENIGKPLAQKLVNAGIKILIAKSGEAALQFMKSHIPDLIITEIDLPGMSGWELCSTIKNRSLPKMISFIFISADPNSQERMRSLFVGGKAYLGKPVNQEELEQEILKIFRRASSRSTTRLSAKTSLRGNLRSMPIPDIMQMISNYQKSGILRIKNPVPGMIYFRDGVLLDAKWKEKSGVAAFYRIVAQMEGDFEFDENLPPQTQQVIEEDWMGLLMEGLRLRDEVEALREVVGGSLTSEDWELLEELIFMGILTKEDVLAALQNRVGNLTLSAALIQTGKVDSFTINRVYQELQREREKAKAATRRFTQRLAKRQLQKELEKSQGGEGSVAQESTSRLEALPDKRLSTSEGSMAAAANRDDTQLMRLSYLAKKSGDSTKSKESVADSIFQRLLLSLSLLTTDQINECVQEQVRLKLQNVQLTFEEVLLRKGYLDERTIDHVMHLENENGDPLIPGYRVTQLLGEGGLAAVYLAVDVNDESKKVAIKVFAPPMSDTSNTVVRFIRECEVAKTLDHPNIVKAYDFGEFYGLYYIVMEYLEGMTLADKIINDGALEEREAIEIFEKVLVALYKAWGQNFIHRDIKPANIMIGKDFVKICDFGLAKALDTDLQLTQAGTIVGTPHYMSPEQFAGKELDYRTDVYSLGVTLYAMLTAHLPFAGTSQVALSQAHISLTPPDPKKFHVTISKPMTAFLFKLLSKEPEDRCKSPEELLDNLRRVKRGQMPKGVIRYYQRKRRKKMAIAATLLFLLLAGGGAYFWLEHQKKLNQQKEKEIQEQERLAKLRIEQEKKKAEEENKRRREEMERQKREAERRKRELEEARRKAREEAERRKKQKLEERRKKLELAKKNVHKNLKNLNFKVANEMVATLVKNYPEEKEIAEMATLIEKLATIDEQLEKKSFTGFFTEAVKISKNKVFRNYLFPIFTKYIRLYPSFRDKAEIVGIWLKLGKNSWEELAEFLQEERDLSWVSDLFVRLPKEEIEGFLQRLANKGTPKLREFAKRVQGIKTAIEILKNLSAQPTRIRDIVSLGSVKEVLTKSYAHLTRREKLQIIENFPYIVPYAQEEVLKELLFLLNKEDKEMRLKFIQTLRRIRNRWCEKFLESLLIDKDPSLRLEVVKALGERKNYKALAKALRDPDFKIREKAISYLAKGKGKKILPFLAQALSSYQIPSVRIKAAQVLGELGEGSAQILTSLKEMLEESNEELIRSGAEALGKILAKDSQAQKKFPDLCKEVVDSLREAIDNIEKTKTGNAIIEALGRIQTDQAISALIEILGERVLYKNKITSVLVKIGKPAIRKLVLTFRSEPGLRFRIAKVLEDIGRPAVPALCSLLATTGNQSVKKKLIKILGNIGDKRAVYVLRRHLTNKKLRRYCKRALANIAAQLPDSDPQKRLLLQLSEE